jgi:Xaa-Pro aminopeptidase
MADTHHARRERLRDRLAEADLDAALVTRLVNVRYLTGFTGSHAALLVTPGAAVLATDGRYDTQAAAEAPDVERVIDRRCAEALAARAAGEGVHRLGFESHDVSVDLHGRLASLAEGADLVSLRQAVEVLRQVKDEEEIDCLREACAIADRSLAEVIDGLLVGRTEFEVALELERRMIDHGAEAVAFPAIVATGPNSAIPHHRPTERQILPGDFLKIDFGARVRGYNGDMTRTFVIESDPTDWQIELYDLVFAAQKAGREALAPGADVRDVDRAARQVIEAAGYGPQFPHGLGHGVGLEIHEAPLLGYGATGRLSVRTPVTVEPGVYLPGRGGVRIEDTLVVRDDGDGGPELLTLTTKELLVLD